MAGFLEITPMTLRNWRKHKPKLYEKVMQGFAFEEAVKVAKENYERLKEVSQQSKT